MQATPRPKHPGAPAHPHPAPACPDAPRTPEPGLVRVVIERITPSIDEGRFAVKRTVGEAIRVEADIFCDAHDALSAVVRHRHIGSGSWHEVRMNPLVNDRWFADLAFHAEGVHEFMIEAWVDHFSTWQRDLRRRDDAGQDLASELLVGAALIAHAAKASPTHRSELEAFAATLATGAQPGRTESAMDERLTAAMWAADPRRHAATSERPVPVCVDRTLARFSSWYELFPRSASGDITRHGTFRDVIARLDRIAQTGFDVLYLPPIHPIGRQFRKGKNNTLDAKPDDVGSPWAIGGPEGGHDAIHPQLGSVDDFKRLVKEANTRGIEVALDLALQCSPDHPYVKSHPEWFKHRPDGTIQYAENPPKKYQDIYPFDFECEHWQALWNEILRVVLLWVDRGVRVFRVDNPHTKPFALWEWLIAEVKKRDTRVLFLAEAFTRPKVMHRLAKLGFTQSYTYFTWRNTAWDLREYFTELASAPTVDCFRPNVWPNTPDILSDYLHQGGRAAFVVRAALAATLAASWGVYAPAFELMECTPVKPGSEEYLDSEKYQLRAWQLDRPDSLAPLLAALNKARRENPALQHDRTLLFHPCDNPSIICYSKTFEDNAVVVAANLDPHNTQWGRVNLDLKALAIEHDRPYQMHDLLTDIRYRWHGPWNSVGLDPATGPVHIFRVRRQHRSETQFEYFL